VNDAGYSTQTDRAGAHALVQYRKLTPDRWTSERTFWVSKWWTWNWGWQSQGDGWQANATLRLKNLWRTSAQVTYAERVWDDKLTRGGPTVIRPGNRGLQLALVTDPRKKAVVSLGGSYTSRDYDASALALDAQVAWRPIPALTLSVGRRSGATSCPRSTCPPWPTRMPSVPTGAATCSATLVKPRRRPPRGSASQPRRARRCRSTCSRSFPRPTTVPSRKCTRRAPTTSCATASTPARSRRPAIGTSSTRTPRAPPRRFRSRSPTST